MRGRGMRPWTWGLLSKQHCAQAAVQRYVGRMVRCVGPCTWGSPFTTTSILGREIHSEKRGREFGPEYTTRRSEVKNYLGLISLYSLVRKPLRPVASQPRTQARSGHE